MVDSYYELEALWNFIQYIYYIVCRLCVLRALWGKVCCFFLRESHTKQGKKSSFTHTLAYSRINNVFMKASFIRLYVLVDWAKTRYFGPTEFSVSLLFPSYGRINFDDYGNAMLHRHVDGKPFNFFINTFSRYLI